MQYNTNQLIMSDECINLLAVGLIPTTVVIVSLIPWAEVASEYVKVLKTPVELSAYFVRLTFGL